MIIQSYLYNPVCSIARRGGNNMQKNCIQISQFSPNKKKYMCELYEFL